MRLFLAILLCKLSRAALRLLGRGGTALPGTLALKLCPDIVARLSRELRCVVVTGTNGKTTTCRMIEKMLADAGLTPWRTAPAPTSSGASPPTCAPTPASPAGPGSARRS